MEVLPYNAELGHYDDYTTKETVAASYRKLLKWRVSLSFPCKKINPSYICIYVYGPLLHKILDGLDLRGRFPPPS